MAYQTQETKDVRRKQQSQTHVAAVMNTLQMLDKYLGHQPQCVCTLCSQMKLGFTATRAIIKDVYPKNNPVGGKIPFQKHSPYGR